MYIIYAVDPQTRRHKLLASKATASEALAAHEAAAKDYSELLIEAGSEGLIEAEELSRRAAAEAE